MKTEKRIPRREEICGELIRRIRNEEWMYGTRLPSFEELGRHYQVSMITIIGAVRLAEEKGFVETRQGSGTYVTWRREDLFFPSVRRGGRNIEVTHALLAPSPLSRFIMRQLAECFMNVYTDVNIRLVEVKASRHQSDPYLQRITNGDMPCCGEFFWHAVYAKLDALFPLDELPGFDSLKNELLPQALYKTRDASGEARCHAIYQSFGLPSHTLVNRSWLNALKVSLPEKVFNWAQICRMLRHAGGKNVPGGMFAGAFQMPNAWHGVKSYLEMMGQSILGNGYDPVSADTAERILESESARYALENLQEILSLRPGGILLGKPDENFALGRVGILPFASSWTHHLLATMNAEWECVAGHFPSVLPETVYRPFYSGFSIGIFRDGIRNRDQLLASWNWLKFLLCRQAQELGTQTMTLTVRRDGVPYLAEMNPGVCELSGKILEKAVPQPDFVGMRRIFSDLSPVLGAFLRRELSATQCLEKLRSVCCSRSFGDR